MARAITRLFQGVVFGAASLGLAFIVGSSNQSYAQSAGDQCISGLHQYSDGLLRRFEPTGGAYLTIGDSVSSQLQSSLAVDNQDIIINASGYNTIDGLIYSLVTDPIGANDAEHNGLSGGLANTQRPNYVHLVSTDPATGEVTDLGESTQAGVTGYTLTQALTNVQTWNGSEWSHTSVGMGDMHGGYLYVGVGGSNDSDNKIYKIDVSTNTYEVIDVTYTTGGVNPGTVELSGDLVYLDGFLYTIEGSHTRNWPFPSRLVRIEVAAGTGVATVVDTLPIQDRLYGSLWLAEEGSGHRLFAYDNADGQVYEVFDFVSGTPSASPMVQMSASEHSDGISCVNAELTGFEVTPGDDAANAETNTAAIVDWRGNDEGTAAFSLDSFDATSAEGGLVENNGDGTFTYTPPTDFEGTDTFGYEVCLDGVVPQTCSSALVAITVEAPAQPDDDSNTDDTSNDTTDDNGGSVLGATTGDTGSADGNNDGQVLGAGDVLAETGSPAQTLMAAGVVLIVLTAVVTIGARQQRVLYRY